MNENSVHEHMSMTLCLYDTYTRRLREFQPLHPPDAGLYSCGPTVYNYAHIGNLRTYLFVDLLRRVLMLKGYNVKHVMNITDVGHLVSDADTGEDKMESGVRRTPASILSSPVSASDVKWPTSVMFITCLTW